MSAPLPPSPIAAPLPDALPFAALVARLPPAARAAYHHERRRGRDEIEALTYGVVIPDVIEIMFQRRSA